MKNRKLFSLLLVTSLTGFFIINFVYSQGPPPIPDVTDHSIPLKIGWNMISVPVSEVQEGAVYRVPTPGDILGCGSLTLWEYSAAENKYIQPTNLSPMKGYWVYSETNCNAAIRGKRADAQRTLLANHWEMISSRYSFNQINNQNPKCALKSQIYHYDPTKNDYITLTADAALNDSKGYWVITENGCVVKEAVSSTCPNIVFPAVEPTPGCRWEYQYDNNRCVIGRKEVCPPSTAFAPIGLGNILTRNDFISPPITDDEWKLMTQSRESLYQMQYHNNIIYYPVYDLPKGQIRLYAFNTATQKWSFPFKTFNFFQRPDSFRTLKENDNIYFVMVGGTSGGILKYNITQDKLENIDINTISGRKDLIQKDDLVSVYQDNIYLLRNERNEINNIISVFKLNKATGELIKEYSDTISDTILMNTDSLMPTGNNVINGEIIFFSHHQSRPYNKDIVSAYNIAQKRYYRVMEVDSVVSINSPQFYTLKGNNRAFGCRITKHVIDPFYPQLCLNIQSRSIVNFLSVIGLAGDDIYSIFGTGKGYALVRDTRTPYSYQKELAQNVYVLNDIRLDKNGSAYYQYDASYKGLLSTFLTPYCPVINKNMWCLRATTDNKLNFVIIGVED